MSFFPRLSLCLLINVDNGFEFAPLPPFFSPNTTIRTVWMVLNDYPSYRARLIEMKQNWVTFLLLLISTLAHIKMKHTLLPFLSFLCKCYTFWDFIRYVCQCRSCFKKKIHPILLHLNKVSHEKLDSRCWPDVLFLFAIDHHRHIWQIPQRPNDLFIPTISVLIDRSSLIRYNLFGALGKYGKSNLKINQ